MNGLVQIAAYYLRTRNQHVTFVYVEIDLH